MKFRTLTVYDVSSMVHAATNSKSSFDYFKGKYGSTNANSNILQGLPIGGIKYILNNALMKLANGHDIIFVFDSKIDMGSEYKADRKRNPAVNVQRDMLLDICNSIRLSHFKLDGFEADHLIKAVVDKYKDDYSAIDIVCGDSDLAANIISPRIRIRASASIYSDIDVNNYSVMVKRGAFVPYNMILPYFFVYGKPSNTVPPLENCDPKSMFNSFLECITRNDVDPALGSTHAAFVLWLQDGLRDKQITEEQGLSYLKRMEFIYPKLLTPEQKLLVPEPTSHASELNIDRLREYVKAFELYRIAQIYQMMDVNTTSPFPMGLKEYLAKYCDAYMSGDYAVDRDDAADLTFFFDAESEFETNVEEFVE